LQTAEDLREMARRYFRDEARTIVTLKPAAGVGGGM